MAVFILPFIGAGINRKTATKEFDLGTVQIDDDKNTWVYVQAPAIVAAAAVVILTEPAFTVATGAGAYTNGSVAFAAGEYGWVFKTTDAL